MEKRKPWQLYVILTVVLLTLINILPTIFYYSNPLKEPITEEQAKVVAVDIVERVQKLEQDSIDWLRAYTKHLNLSATSIQQVPNSPALIEVSFESGEHTNIFRRMLSDAGLQIPFHPAQLELSNQASSDPEHKVLVKRRIAVQLSPNEVDDLFFFAAKWDENGDVTERYRQVAYDRVVQLVTASAGTSTDAAKLEYISQNPDSQVEGEWLLGMARDIVEISEGIGESAPASQRFFASFSQTDSGDGAKLINTLTQRFDNLKGGLQRQKERLEKEVNKQQDLDDEGAFVDMDQLRLLELVQRQQETLQLAQDIVKRNLDTFKSGQTALDEASILKELAASKPQEQKGEFSGIAVGNRNPWIAKFLLDWDNDRVIVELHPDVEALRSLAERTEEEQITKEKVSQLVFNEIARVSRITEEQLVPEGQDFVIALNQLTSSSRILAMDLGKVAQRQSEQLSTLIKEAWMPQHPDLTREQFPIWDYETYQQLPAHAKQLGLLVYVPGMDDAIPPEGFQYGSIYVIAKGLYHIVDKYEGAGESTEVAQLEEDLAQLRGLLSQNRLATYRGDAYGMDSEYSYDGVFQISDYASNLLAATREDFYTRGTKRYAVLEMTNYEQRLHTTNKIENSIQEDLLKWKDQYNTALVDLDQTAKFQVPPPSKNAFWENFKLSLRKYFRGDENRIIQWGQDLQGGKTVRIGLRDQNNQPVTNEEDLNQAVNELYTRVNKLGVSERTIRIESQKIVLEFPGSQALSASDLVKGSTMSFHIVNERFTPSNRHIGPVVNQFLQSVWNEAVVTNRTDAESVKMIAWEHLGGDEESGLAPPSEEARILRENGLVLANPHETPSQAAFDEKVSTVAVLRGEDPSEWYGLNHPLMVVFHNYALEGSSLTGVQAGYDPTKGHQLYFNVKGSYTGERSGNPRDDFYTWTSRFNKNKVAGTPMEEYSHGAGWRMAIILNGRVISAPTLTDGLRDGGNISGNFSQREVNRLVADLKAGSLSFTPKILSETNVSPDLGQQERTRGIMASIFGLLLVVVAMVGYYRFAGIIASIAVTLNLLIMWAVLQNLGAALTLPGIAGIILTVGMAVDANVLVFERIREEFATSGRIASAIGTGYRKAFSAIVDSNLTTILAALILIQFDAGPIKGFAITLIIGIISSMFTALFLTRYFFAGWVQNAKNKELKMRDWVGKPDFRFLEKAKYMMTVSLVVALVGGGLLWMQRHTMFGMDFTGGYTLSIEVEEMQGVNYRGKAHDALEAAGAAVTDFQVKRLNKTNQLRIQFGQGMEEEGRPFYGMPEELEGDTFAFAFQKNPRIIWVVNALETGGLELKPQQFESLEQNWSTMSGQFSDVMRNHAIMALSLALVCILIYITFRFEFKYAVAAIAALTHDVVVTVAIMAILHKLGLPVQIDLEVIGAIMTIIGYSLNDTIIIFDRIREDVRILRKLPFVEVVHHALNITLSRTLMTSGTTLLVLLTLVTFGGSAIFAFALIMCIGVVVGTLSSLFIASPVMLYIHNKEEEATQPEMKRVKAEG